jgi:hypothetical protein
LTRSISKRQRSGSATGRTNEAWRNHYLPRFYLRQFTDHAGQVWRTLLGPDGQVREDPFTPKATGYEPHLYTITAQVAHDRVPAPDRIETQFFSPIDNAAAVALHELKTKAPSALSDGQREGWAIFVNSLLERIPSRLRERGELARGAAREHLDNFLQGRSDKEWWTRVLVDLNVDALADNTVRLAMVKEIADKNVIDYFKTMTWIKASIANGAAIPFITGDSPVVINVGTNGPIHVISIALSPRNLLVMYGGKLPGETLRQIVLTHNLLVIAQSRYLFSNGPLSDGPLLKNRSAAKVGLMPATWSRSSGERPSAAPR